MRRPFASVPTMFDSRFFDKKWNQGKRSETVALKSSTTLSIPNASSNRLFDAQPKSSDAAPSIVIQPIVMYVRSSANRTLSERSRMDDASVVSRRRSLVLTDMIEVVLCNQK